MINQRSGELEEPYIYCPYCGKPDTEEAFDDTFEYFCQACAEFFNEDDKG